MAQTDCRGYPKQRRLDPEIEASLYVLPCLRGCGGSCQGRRPRGLCLQKPKKGFLGRDL